MFIDRIRHFAVGISTLAALAGMACTDGELCDDQHPCREGDVCIGGICVEKSSSFAEQSCTEGPHLCSGDAVCLKEKSGKAFCRSRCRSDRSCANTSETCTCRSLQVQICYPIHRIPLNGCFKDPSAGIAGICTVRCMLGAPNEPWHWCSCPYNMFGVRVACEGYYGNATPSNPFCVPKSSGNLAAWPTCSKDTDCGGKFAVP